MIINERESLKMSDTVKKFRLMMNLAREYQRNFKEKLKELNHDDLSSNYGEFPNGTLLTPDDLKDSTYITNDDLAKSNQRSIDELNDLKVSSPSSTTGYLADISRSLRSIVESLNNIEDCLIHGKNSSWNDC